MAKVTIDAVSSLVGQIYEAAYDQERWQDALVSLRDVFGGSRACIMRRSPERATAVTSVADPELRSPRAIGAYLSDPYIGAISTVPAGLVFRRSDILDERGFRRHELWQDWFKPRDMYSGISCNLLASKGVHWFIDVQRGRKQEELSGDEVSLFERLLPHVQRAGQIGDQFQKKIALAGAFSHLPFGVLMVDGHRRILQMNEAAEAALARPDSPLRAVGREIAASTAKDTQMLERLVIGSCSSPDDVMPGTGGSMIIPSDPAQQRFQRFVVSVSPFLKARIFGLESDRCAVIMMREMSLANPVGFAEQIRGLFALTAAEAKIANCLASGLTLSQAAEESAIRITTARWYLDEIFRKTGTNKQGQLIALLKSLHLPRLR